MTSEPLPQQRESRASETGRLEAFSDGVLAVAVYYVFEHTPSSESSSPAA
ncbi:MAG: hypothetical protein ACRDZ8_00835 [Acidimicrobiales bacterium]